MKSVIWRRQILAVIGVIALSLLMAFCMSRTAARVHWLLQTKPEAYSRINTRIFTKRLNLTKEQRAVIASLLLTHKQRMNQTYRTEAKDWQEFYSSYPSLSADGVRQHVINLSSGAAERQRLRAELNTSLKNILTPPQQRKFSQAMVQDLNKILEMVD